MGGLFGKPCPYLILFRTPRPTEQQISYHQEKTDNEKLYKGIITQLRKQEGIFIKNITHAHIFQHNTNGVVLRSHFGEGMLHIHAVAHLLYIQVARFQHIVHGAVGDYNRYGGGI